MKANFSQTLLTVQNTYSVFTDLRYPDPVLLDSISRPHPSPVPGHTLLDVSKVSYGRQEKGFTPHPAISAEFVFLNK